jgi:hypothetical protein
MFFAVTYTDGSVEEIEADECQDGGGRYLTFVRYRIPVPVDGLHRDRATTGPPGRSPGG